jgi:hypothetical protein
MVPHHTTLKRLANNGSGFGVLIMVVGFLIKNLFWVVVSTEGGGVHEGQLICQELPPAGAEVNILC